jgi:hypothetical protein
MFVQYLVGLCCVRATPSAVEVVVGDMVMDTAANKKRDVDVTVTVEVEPGCIEGYLAYEVKHEKGPVDVITVEGLCAKLADMPQLSSRAIVSSSGFTEAAQNKAAARGVKLYTLEPWNEPVAEFFNGSTSLQGLPHEAIRACGQILLIWENWQTYTVADGAPESFTTLDDTPVYTSKGKLHKTYKSFSDFREAMLLRSTSTLFGLPPALQHHAQGASLESAIRTPPWPMTHTLETGGQQAYLKFDDKLCLISGITIYGTMCWREFSSNGQYYIMRGLPDRQPFAAAIIMGGFPSAVQWAIVMAPGSAQWNMVKIELEERHVNAIRGLKLDIL